MVSFVQFDRAGARRIKRPNHGQAKNIKRSDPLYAHYRKRGSASYMVREVRSVRERERDTEREREREREREPEVTSPY